MRAWLISDPACDATVFDALVASGYATTRMTGAPDKDMRCGHADLVVVDFGVSGPPLMDIVSGLRARQSMLRMLALLHDSQPSERVAVLDAGADDCLSRPFDPVELNARIRALERRGGRDIVHVGGLSWDRENRQGEIDGTRIALSASETAVLAALLNAPGSVVPISRLMGSLGDGARLGGHDRLYVHICRIRKKLAASALQIVNVNGFGYVLKA